VFIIIEGRVRAGRGGVCIYLASVLVVEKRRKRSKAQIALVVSETLAAGSPVAPANPNPCFALST
jgi:transcription initiation factor TFIIIB Brf1 subunit/transcription initiation factor TFIIB